MNADSFFQQGLYTDLPREYQGTIANHTASGKQPPDYAIAYLKQGMILCNELKDYQGAIADLTRAIKINPNLAEAYYYRGFARYCVGDYAGAIADYDE
ncbi:MAG: tetratricopeptide repeat protein, partial [Trichormus sp.]